MLSPGQMKKNVVYITDFGAIDGDTTIVQVSNKVGSNLGFQVDKQTRTGIAIQEAIDYVGKSGGGAVLIPPGTWYVYSYIVVKYPNLTIAGAGNSSVLKSMANAPCKHGYGILQIGFSGKDQPETGFVDIEVADLKLDGNIYERGNPSGEFQMYNLAIYGDNVRVAIRSVTSINSGIDCLMIAFKK